MNKSDESGSSDEEQEKEKKRKAKKIIPVMDQVFKVKVKTKGIVMNVSMTKYDVVADVAEALDWYVHYTNKKGDWDVLWIDSMIEPDTLIKMHFFQKINHFPGIHVLARKNLLGMSFMEMRKKFPDQYNFFPRTWLLPNDYPEFRQEVEKGAGQDQPPCYIVKPEADCQGRGIFLTFKTDEVENGKHYVVQDYIKHPFLVDGLKFDFRVYVLLCGTSPMRLYCYEEGLARFATEKYMAPDKHNLKKLFMHLTNYAINKKNPKFVYNSSVHNMGSGHKRSMTSVFLDMKRRGFNVKNLKSKIYDVLVKTVILGLPLVSHQYKFAQPDDQNRNMCFHILGVDIMIDEFFNPIVLEVNHTPSFATDTPLDYHIKFNLIKDTLVLLNINEQNKKQLVKKTNSYQRERVTNAKRLIETEEKRNKVEEAQKRRDQYEATHLGRYTKIYPLKDQTLMQEYAQLMKHAEKIYFSENNQIRAQIQQEKNKEKLKGKEQDRKIGSHSSNLNSPNKISYQKNSVHSAIDRAKFMRNMSYDDKSDDDKNQNSGNSTRPALIQISPDVKQPSQAKKIGNFSSLLNQPLGNLIPTHFQSSSFTPSINNKKISAQRNQFGIKKFTQSINEKDLEQQFFSSTKKINLPKIEQLSTMKSSTLQISKNRMKSEFKTKNNEKDPEKGIIFKDKKSSGEFLTPKVMKFENYDETVEKTQKVESPQRKRERIKLLEKFIGL